MLPPGRISFYCRSPSDPRLANHDSSSRMLHDSEHRNARPIFHGSPYLIHIHAIPLLRRFTATNCTCNHPPCSGIPKGPRNCQGVSALDTVSSRERSIPKHNQSVCDDVGNAKVKRRERITRDNVLQHKHSLSTKWHQYMPNSFTSTVPLTTEPAKPPAIKAKPRNKTSRAFQATPVPE